MNVEEAAHRLEETIDQPVRVDTNSKRVTPKVSDLEDAGVIGKAAGRETWVLLKNSEGDVRARAEYIEYDGSDIASFEMVAVDDDIQGNGIGSALVETVSDELLQTNEAVYVLPLHDESAYLMEKNGYWPAEKEGLDGWYIRR